MMLDDRGAVAIVTAVLLALTLLGVATVALDASALYAEKRELQNVADASALAIAEDCVNRPPCALVDAEEKAAMLAELNSTDALSDTKVTLEPTKVTVVASTRSSSGTVLPAWFSGRSDNGTVTAKAVVSWGGLGAYSGLPVTISVCEWAAATAGGYAPKGPYPPNPPVSYQKILKLHTTAGLPSCDAGPSGADAPGGFGWLEEDDCVAESSTGFFPGDPGVGLPADCKDPLADAWAAREPVFLPIFDEVTGTGAGTEYRIAGYAAFVITGYSLPGGNKKSWLDGQTVCTGSDKCIAGFFTEALVAGTPGGGSYGAIVPPRLVD